MKVQIYRILVALLLLLSVILESSLISIPLFLIFSIILFLFDNSKKIILYIFLLSLLLDSVHVQNLGTTGLFVLSSFLILSFYKKNFEVGDFKIIILVTFVSALLYSQAIGYNSNYIYASGIIAISVFMFKTLFLRMSQNIHK